MNNSGSACARDLAKSAIWHCYVWVVELGVIEEIEELRPVLKFIPLAEREDFVSGKIDVKGSGSDEDITSSIAEGIVRRRREGAGGEPLHDLVIGRALRVSRRCYNLRLVIAYLRKAEREISAGLNI